MQKDMAAILNGRIFNTLQFVGNNLFRSPLFFKNESNPVVGSLHIASRSPIKIYEQNGATNHEINAPSELKKGTMG